MRKRIVILLLMLIITTGCTCEYNLKIENGTYKETVVLESSDASETANFNKQWNISTNKTINNLGLDPSPEEIPVDNVYSYNLTGNKLTFNYDFNQNEYKYSTAISKCYANFSISNYNNRTVISTSSNPICFDDYPNLTKVTIKITVDEKVVSSNADTVNDNTYTWILTKENKKAINLIMGEGIESVTPTSSVITTTKNNGSIFTNNNKKDYTLIIFCGILLVLVLISYLIYKIIKKNENNMDV